MITQRVGRNAIILDLSDHVKVYPVVYVIDAVTFIEKPSDIEQPVQGRAEPIPLVDGPEFKVYQILSLLERGLRNKFLEIMKLEPSHDA